MVPIHIVLPWYSNSSGSHTHRVAMGHKVVIQDHVVVATAVYPITAIKGHKVKGHGTTILIGP